MNWKRNLWLGMGLMLCALAGAGIEHVRQGRVKPESVAPAEVTDHLAKPLRPKVVAVRDDSAERAAVALRKRVAELEKALAEREVERVQKSETPVVEQAREVRPRGQSWEDRMAKLKKDDPEQYAEMQKRREEFRQTMEQRVRDRAEFIDAVDVKSMTEPQRENHEKLLATVARVNELMAQMGAPGAENTHEVRHEMGQTLATLGELYTEERRYLFEETAKAVGYQGADASAFADQMQNIVDNTTMMPGFGMHGGGHRDGATGSSGGGAPAGGDAPAK